MALAHLKINRPINVLATDRSDEAQACRLFYDTTRQTVNAEFKWPFATTQSPLALIMTNPFPDSEGNSEWMYAYQYPAACMNFVRILGGPRNPTRRERVSFRIVNGTQGMMILTDVESAIGEFTMEIFSEDSFGAQYALALSFKLASYIAPMVTGGDQFKLGDRALKMYQMEITSAQANAMNEEQMEEDPESEFIEARR